MYFFTKGLVILIGSAAVALGINVFLTPYQILDGGVVGIALILHYIYKLKIGLMIIVISIPIFVISWYKYRAYFYNSIHGLFAYSLSIDLLKPFRNLIHVDAIYSAIFVGYLWVLVLG